MAASSTCNPMLICFSTKPQLAVAAAIAFTAVKPVLGGSAGHLRQPHAALATSRARVRAPHWAEPLPPWRPATQPPSQQAARTAESGESGERATAATELIRILLVRRRATAGPPTEYCYTTGTTCTQ